MACTAKPLLPFLWPQLPIRCRLLYQGCRRFQVPIRRLTTEETPRTDIPLEDEEAAEISRLNPDPSDYGRSVFADKATLEISAGSGGHGCVSFLREKFIADGPPNGGNGGDGGNVYIQAIREETSLHRAARQRFFKAGRGKNGQGSNKGGKRGDDVLIQVPVGTVVREVSRTDPVADEEDRRALALGRSEMDAEEEETRGTWRRDKWILYPSGSLSDFARMEFPSLPRARRSSTAALQPPAPIFMDLSKPMAQPILLAAGAVGGYGNPHFMSRTRHRPKMATRGDQGMELTLELELKLLADVGFVGMPNAGKSTLLRALSKSRARVGNWEFTTLQPNIGTVVLDDHRDRPQLQVRRATGEPRTHMSIADIPGLIKDAHLDRGLGLGFLRHVERAQVLAFVIDLSRGNAVETLKTLWKELGEFENLKSQEVNLQTETRQVEWSPLGTQLKGFEDGSILNSPRKLQPITMAPISTKPWFVVATKADLESSRANFAELQSYLDALGRGQVAHPSGNKHCWKGRLAAMPVSAIRGEGVDRIPAWTVSLLQD